MYESTISPSGPAAICAACRSPLRIACGVDHVAPRSFDCATYIVGLPTSELFALTSAYVQDMVSVPVCGSTVSHSLSSFCDGSPPAGRSTTSAASDHVAPPSVERETPMTEP